MDENNTIYQVVKDGLCTGCGTCAALCPTDAIKLTTNEKRGIYIPELNEERCNNCGICYKVCPGHKVDFKALNLEIFGKEPENILIGNYLNCYVGHATDYDIRYNSTSGGLVTQLLIFALKEGIIDGALVTRMKKDDPLEPEPFIARTKEEIIEASGSKYCPVPANIALKEILESKEGEKFAVVGLPCHIHGIKKAEQMNKKLKEKIILRIGIICSKCPNFLATDYLLKKFKIQKDDITSISYRGEGYPGGMNIKLEDGKNLFFNFWDYYDTCFGQFFSPMRCRLCIDFTCELADISFGDVFFDKIASEDKIGTSIIISRTGYGEKFLRSNPDIAINPVGVRKFVECCDKNISFKKSDLNVRKLFLQKKFPKYNAELLETCSTYNMVFLILYRIGNYLSYKQYFWKLLRAYGCLVKLFSRAIVK